MEAVEVNGYTIEPGADLSGANLKRANLAGANLEGANLKRANLSGPDFKEATYRSLERIGIWHRANLAGANLAVWDAAGKPQKNGQRRISVSTLGKLVG